MKPVARGGAETLVALLDSERGTGSAKTGQYSLSLPDLRTLFLRCLNPSCWCFRMTCCWILLVKERKTCPQRKDNMLMQLTDGQLKGIREMKNSRLETADCCEFAVPELQGEDLFPGMPWLTCRSPDPDWRVHTLTHRQTILSWQTIFQSLK